MNPKMFEIWRQRKGESPKLLRSLSSQKEVDMLMKSYWDAEVRMGVGITKNDASGFTCYKSCLTIITEDASGLPESREAMLPVAHYWQEYI